MMPHFVTKSKTGGWNENELKIEKIFFQNHTNIFLKLKLEVYKNFIYSYLLDIHFISSYKGQGKSCALVTEKEPSCE